ncbi:MAG TPA: hypothetical protein VG274_13200 [Rhizomicrobium sp.]|nr:hypothetical protein [Rhizomicrobium sp.]
MTELLRNRQANPGQYSILIQARHSGPDAGIQGQRPALLPVLIRVAAPMRIENESAGELLCIHSAAADGRRLHLGSCFCGNDIFT